MPVGVTIAAVTALLLGAKGSGGPSHFLVDVDKQIKSAVQDKNRRKAILAETGKLSKQLKKLEKEINENFGDFVAVHSDYQAEADDFDLVSQGLSDAQQQMAKLIIDAREMMRELMTEDEWTLVFPSVGNENTQGEVE